MNFLQTLTKIVKKNQSLVCCGLDSDATKLPQSVSHHKNPQFMFNKTIIERTHDLVCAYKLNSAFYESEGIEGIQALHDTVHYINKNYSEIPVILDAKRADISNTNEGYIRFAFDYLGVQAITLHPYLGKEALLPFLKQKEKGLFILCKTSNPGSGEFQNLDCHGRPLFEIVAEQV